jgi:hypothetical protein
MTIYEEMLTVADKDHLPENHILRVRGRELRAVIEGGCGTVRLGALLRARRIA